MSKKRNGLLKQYRKEIKVRPKDVDVFINAKHTSTKYYLEESFETNKLFRYLLLLKLNGASIDKFFNDYIKINKLKK